MIGFHSIRDTQTSPGEIIREFAESLKNGVDWNLSLIQAISNWTLPEEIYNERKYKFFILGEAFDWLVLAERLCHEVRNILPTRIVENLLVNGSLSTHISSNLLRNKLGVAKHRGYLNYFYGVTVEEALQLANEREIQKHHISNGNQYQEDFADEGFEKTYIEPKDKLLKQFRMDTGYEDKSYMSLTESKEFTYWLFKWRLGRFDGAKSASDTQKGLREYHRMNISVKKRRLERTGTQSKT